MTRIITALLLLVLTAPLRAYDDEITPKENAACAAQWNQPWVPLKTLRELFAQYAGNPNFERAKVLAEQRMKSHGYLNAPGLHPFNGNVSKEGLDTLASCTGLEVREYEGLPMLFGDKDCIEPVPFGAFAALLPETYPLPRSGRWTKRKEAGVSVELPEEWTLHFSVPKSSVPAYPRLSFSAYAGLSYARESLSVSYGSAQLIGDNVAEVMADQITRSYAGDWQVHGAVKRLEKPGWECYAWTARNLMDPRSEYKQPDSLRGDEVPVECQQFEARAVCGAGGKMFRLSAELPFVSARAQKPLEEPLYKEGWETFARILRSLEIPKSK